MPHEEKVRVAIRVRPYLDHELPSVQDEHEQVAYDRELLTVDDEKTINI